MARILVLGSAVGDAIGGAELLTKSLIEALERAGHEASALSLPLRLLPKEGLLNYAALWRSLDLSSYQGRAVDLVIATKFPTYFARHQRKSVWLVHQHRQLYDLYGSGFSDVTDDPRDEMLRRWLVDGEDLTLGEAQYRSGISKTVVNRLRDFNGLDAEVLYPPLPMGARYRAGRFENYILSVGRLCNIKRLDLMIRALATVDKGISLKVVGTPDEPGIMEFYHNEIDVHHVKHRVEFLGKVEESELISLFANAKAVFYAPYEEDYGYVTLEAFASAKPVITAIDSGGVLEFVRHNENGVVLEPRTAEFAHGINALLSDEVRLKQLGKSGREFVERAGLLDRQWDHVVKQLLSPLSVAQPRQANQ